MDSLRKRVLERDRLHNTPRQMAATTRAMETKRICVVCRRLPTYEQHVDNWLEAHPPADPNHIDEDETEQLLEAVPPFNEITRCPWCGGQLIEVTW